MRITKHAFGTTQDGRAVTLYRMENGAGAALEALDYGCTVRALIVPDRSGKPVDVVQGYETLLEYETQDGYVGAAIGRYANRLGKAQFVLSGKTYPVAKNDGANHLHGGVKGFDKYVWDAAVEGDQLVFSRRSPDGEEGYPGTLDVRIAYGLPEQNEWTIDYCASTDADTILNLTNHSYFNLSGGGTALDTELSVFADRFTENDAGCLPTGKLLDVEGTPFDFRTSKPLGRDIGADDVQLRNAGGYDHNFVLGGTGALVEAAELYAPRTGIGMRVFTTCPGMQVYSANFTTARNGKHGQTFGYRDAICLETQYYPDSPAHDDFPSTVLKAGERFHERTVYAFFVK